MADQTLSTSASSTWNGGTGKKLGNAVIIVCGVAALSSVIITIVSIWLQTKNYRKPLLQRYVVRILVIVPIFAVAYWASLISLKVSFWIDPFRDVYEAFTIYAFFQLLINFIGGERALIIMMNGRPPVSHIWPLDKCFPKVDISDPHTFLAIKRGILQYTWIKPLLAIATIIMKATGTYQEGYVGLKSGYFWSGLIYNISISVSLYSLALFWICMSSDLKPFRPMPKFLCIKGIIFASYWQGFLLSIFVFLHLIPDNVPGYTSDNLAAAIQDALICFEMPAFAIWHWYAFSWHDYADVTISAARMPVKYALRDAFGAKDLIQDAKETFRGTHYGYRYFDTGDNVLSHEESRQRAARMMEGMRYERGGKGKYWIPKPGEQEINTPLLKNSRSGSDESPSRPSSQQRPHNTYGATGADHPSEPELDEEEEKLYANARAMEFGDWNYPVITAHHASREDHLHGEPTMITNATNRHLMQPTKDYRRRRKEQVDSIQKNAGGKPGEDPVSDTGKGSKAPLKRSSSHASAKTDRSQLVDLIVEDEEAEEMQRVRARKEGSPEWNRHEAKHYVRAYPDAEPEEEVREGFEPTLTGNKQPDQQHTLDTGFLHNDNAESADRQDEEAEHEQQWTQRNYTSEARDVERVSCQDDDDDRNSQDGAGAVCYGNDGNEPNVWASPGR